ncbi:unnamed protein product, partial [Adineta ricciae]
RRRELLNKPTIQGIAIQSSIYKASRGSNEESMSESMVQFHKTGSSKWDSNMIIHYSHESRLSTYERDVHQLWNQHFRQTSVINTRLTIGTKNNPNLTKRPLRRPPNRQQRAQNEKS